MDTAYEDLGKLVVAALLALVLLFVGVAKADTWVRFCTSNPGDGAVCPAYTNVALYTTPPAGVYHILSKTTFFSSWSNVYYVAAGSLAGTAVMQMCVDVPQGTCPGGVVDGIFWGVGSVRGLGVVSPVAEAASVGQGFFGLTAQQDIVFALGIALCGLLGVGVGVRLV